MSGSRNKRLEHQLLSTAELANGAGSGFTAHAVYRLKLGESTYGDGWRALTPRQLLGTIGEEAADIGAWAVLAVQAIAAEPVDGETHAELLTRLNETLGAAAAQYRALTDALRRYDASQERGQ
jgi:hypothetical protein